MSLGFWIWFDRVHSVKMGIDFVNQLCWFDRQDYSGQVWITWRRQRGEDNQKRKKSEMWMTSLGSRRRERYDDSLVTDSEWNTSCTYHNDIMKTVNRWTNLGMIERLQLIIHVWQIRLHYLSKCDANAQEGPVFEICFLKYGQRKRRLDLKH